MKTSFILIDFENVQPGSLAQLRGRDFKVIVFLGATQSKLPTALACELQSLGANAEYVRCAGSGPNALDFHIAYYIGRLSKEHPEASFHIISRDTGFDPLVRHLKAENITCHRAATLSIPPGPTPADDRPVAGRRVKAGPGVSPMDRVIANLAKRGTSKPRKLVTLLSIVKTLLGAGATDDSAAALIAELVERRVVTVAEGKVTYPT